MKIPMIFFVANVLGELVGVRLEAYILPDGTLYTRVVQES